MTPIDNDPWERWVAWVVRWRRTILGVTFVLTLLSALAITRLRFDVEVLSLLPRGEPDFDAFHTLVGELGGFDEMLVLVRGTPGPGLERVTDRLAERLAAFDDVASVRARIDLAPLRSGLLGRWLFHLMTPDELKALTEQGSAEGIARRVEIDRALLASPFDLSTAAMVAEDPLGLRAPVLERLARSDPATASGNRSGYLASPDGSALLILVDVAGSSVDVARAERLLRRARAAADEVLAAEADAAGGRVRVDLGGAPAFAVEHRDALRHDIRRYSLFALGGVLLAFVAGLRDPRALPFVVVPVISSTLFTFPASLVLFDQLNALSLCFTAILYGLSIDSGIHFWVRLGSEFRGQPAATRSDLQRAIAATVRGLALPDFAGSATTAAAFLAIGGSVLAPVRQLGILTAVGMSVTIVQFFVLLPALAAVVHPRHDGAPLESPIAGRLSGWAVRHATGLRIALVIAVVVLSPVAARLTLDPGLVRLQPTDSPAAALQADIERTFDPAGGAGAFLVQRETVEQALADAERVTDALEAERTAGRVHSVRSLTPFLPSASRQRTRLAALETVPRQQIADRLRSELARQRFRLEPFAAFLEHLAGPTPGDAAVLSYDDPALAPLAALRDRHLRVRDGRATVAIYVTPAAGVSWRELRTRVHARLGAGEGGPPTKGAASGAGTIEFSVAARPLLEQRLGETLRAELPLFAGLGILANLALLWASFRHLGIALALLAPVLLALLGTFAAMTASGVALDPVNLVIVALTFGVGVDYGVYLASAAMERGGFAEGARTAGRAILVTALTTVTGFGFLGFSRYPPLASMGTLATISLSLSVAFSLLVLPALLPRLGTPGSAR